ncbi:ferritin [Methanolobus sp.]|uniref:ferritin family protein n=1 Tax=Methanolobus sp. TaxID=1874737 RepID=UPI0025F8E7C6|nr:ferritin [Methanolobus sp.]
MFHEDKSKISEKTLNLKRAIDSLKEELEAVDWYNQRADACTDENLKKILIHNANEEKEHAAMILEWIRQNDEAFAKELKEYLFSDQKDIAGLEEESTTH